MSAVSNDGGSTRQWRNLRREIIRRDKGKCKLCGARGSIVDHIKPRSRGGTDDKSNLRLLCITCEKKKRIRDYQKSLESLANNISDATSHLFVKEEESSN